MPADSNSLGLSERGAAWGVRMATEEVGHGVRRPDFRRCSKASLAPKMDARPVQEQSDNIGEQP